MLRHFSVFFLLISVAASSAFAANSAPVADTFVATPGVAAPGQAIALLVEAHDPDCLAPPCTSGCGSVIRAESLTWSDSSGRQNVFTNSTPSPSGSPWSATATWIAPSVQGVYAVRASFADNGDSTCGNSQARTATLWVTVTTLPAPLVDSFTVAPVVVPAGGTAGLTVIAHDPNWRPLSYAFSAEAGTISHSSPSDPTAMWTAPANARAVVLTCKVTAAGGPTIWKETVASVEVGRYLRSIEVSESRPTRVTPLSAGLFLVVDGATETIAAASPSGQISWRRTGLRSPVAAAVVGSEIFVLERAEQAISVWDLEGEKIREIEIEAAAPNQLAAGPNAGELSVVDTDAARIVVVSSIDGRTLRIIGVGRLKFPTGIAISQDHVAVADAGLGRVVLFTTAGAFVRQIGSSSLFVRPQGITFEPAGRIVVSDSYSGEISVLGTDGTLRGILGGFGSGAGSVINPIDVAMLAPDTIAVTTGGGEIPLFRLLSTVSSLAPPTAVTAEDREGDDGGAIEVRWTRSSDDPPRVTAYRIERATGTAGAFGPVGEVGASNTAWTDLTVVEGSCYRYRVVAKDGATEAASEESACIASRNDLPPPAPAAASAEPESASSAVVTWSAVNAPDLRGYIIELGAGGAPPRRFVVDAPAVRFTATDLIPETAYSVAVRSVDTANNESAPATTTVTTYPDVAPPAPVVTATDSRAGGSIDVAWTIASSRLPVSSFRVEAKPEIAGWPELLRETGASPLRVTGVVNKLAYLVTVTARTPWGRSSEPSAAVRVIPTAPPRQLPVVQRAGWDGSDGIEEASGFAATFSMEGEKRELRFEYRASGARLQFLVDGRAVGAAFGTTEGAWKEARLEVAKRDLKPTGTEHLLDVQNLDFPHPLAQLAVRRLDFVPLAQKDLKSGAFNTVIDLLWTWQEARSDLAAVLLRSPDNAPFEWTAIPCLAPRSGRCRDPFRQNNEKFAYRLAIVSPAGWSSAADDVKGEAKYDPLPPRVTDLVVQPDFTPDGAAAFKLEWTPLSTALLRDGSPERIARYRVYAEEEGRAVMVGEFDAPPVIIPATAFDSERQKLVVRSVDSEGRESE